MRLVLFTISLIIGLNPVLSAQSSFPPESISDGDTILVNSLEDLRSPMVIEGIKNLVIIGNGKSTGIKTFNNLPYILDVKGCKNIEIKNLTIGYGVASIGKGIVKVEASKNITFSNVLFGPNGESGLEVGNDCKSIVVENCHFEGSRKSAVISRTHELSITGSTFKGNNEIGSIKPDIEEDYKVSEMQAKVEGNQFDPKRYTKYFRDMTAYVESKDAMTYKFNTFRIVKKLEFSNGETGTLTAHYEGENNKVLDKVEYEYNEKGNTIDLMVYIYQNRPVYGKHITGKKMHRGWWFVYGNFIKAEDVNEKAESRTPLTVNSSKTEKAWLDTYNNWMKMIEDEKESFTFKKPEELYKPGILK